MSTYIFKPSLGCHGMRDSWDLRKFSYDYQDTLKLHTKKFRFYSESKIIKKIWNLQRDVLGTWELKNSNYVNFHHICIPMTQSYAPTRQMHSLQFTLTSPLGAIWRFSSIRPFPCMLLQFMVCNFAHLSSALAAPIIQELQVVSSSPLGVNSDQETCRIISSKHRPILSALSLSLSLRG